MASRLRIDKSSVDGVTYIRLAGVVDEDSSFPALVSRRELRAPLVIALGEVRRINSYGVRVWRGWIEQLHEKNIDVFLVDCSPEVVAQLSQVSNFAGHAVVVSVYAPYCCPHCDTLVQQRIDVAEALSVDSFRAPPVRCPECRTDMAFDELESSWFGFLRNCTTPELSAKVRRAIDKRRTPSLMTRSSHTSLPSFSSISRSMSSMARGAIEPPSQLHSRPPPPKKRAPPALLVWSIIGLLVVAIGLTAYALLFR